MNTQNNYVFRKDWAYGKEELDDILVHSLMNNGYWINTEVVSRLAQIKSAAKIADDVRLSATEWENLFEKYIESKTLDNNVSTLYEGIKDWDKLAKYANKHVLVILLGAPLLKELNFGAPLAPRTFHSPQQHAQWYEPYRIDEISKSFSNLVEK